MASIQNLSPAQATQAFSDALEKNDMEFVKAYLAHLKTLPAEQRQAFLEATDKDGLMPLHNAISDNNVTVATELLTYYPNGNYPSTQVMTPDEYEQNAPLPLYDFTGKPTPHGCVTKDGCYVFSREYADRLADDGFGYPVEEYNPDVEVAYSGQNPLYMCCHEEGLNGKVAHPQMLNAVVKNATESDYHEAINQAIDRGEAWTIDALLKVGKEKGWAPSQDNIYNMEMYNPVITNVDLIMGDESRSVEEVQAQNHKDCQRITNTFKRENNAKVKSLLRELDSTIAKGDDAKSLEIANRCVDLTMHDVLLDVAKQDNPKALEYLVRAGGDINVPDNNGRTPLIIATQNNQTENIKFLANHPDCNKDAQDNNGQTALHWAVEKKFYKHVKILSEAGARSDVTNKNGVTAMEIAQKNATSADRSILNALTKNQPTTQNETAPSTSNVASVLKQNSQRITTDDTQVQMNNVARTR